MGKRRKDLSADDQLYRYWNRCSRRQVPIDDGEGLERIGPGTTPTAAYDGQHERAQTGQLTDCRRT